MRRLRARRARRWTPPSVRSQADKQAAQISLRTDVGLLASSLAEKIVGEQLKDTELSARVIDRFLDDLEAAPNGRPGDEQSAAPTGEGAVR